MMTSKAVKANSSLEYRLPYFKIENTTGNMIMMTVRVFSLIFSYWSLLSVANLRKLIWSMSAFFVGLQICFARQCYVA